MVRELDPDAFALEGLLEVELLLRDVGKVVLLCLGDYCSLARLPDGNLVPLVELILVQHVLELLWGRN